MNLDQSLEALRNLYDNCDDRELAGLIRDILDVYEEEEE